MVASINHSFLVDQLVLSHYLSAQLSSVVSKISTDNPTDFTPCISASLAEVTEKTIDMASLPQYLQLYRLS
jgi:hypothetical protein